MSMDGVLFWLDAADGNGPAREIIDLDANAFYRCEIKGRQMLKIGLYTSPKVPGCLVSLGRDPAHNDLILPGGIFSRNHCHFFFNKSSVLLLRDTSSTMSTQIECQGLDNNSIYQLQNNPRQRALLHKHKIRLIVGPAHFEIIWHIPEGLEARKSLEKAIAMFAQKRVAPELALTLLDLQRPPPTAYETPGPLTPAVASEFQELPKMDHEKLGFLGSGTFGTVHKTVDLHTGDLWAVKTSNYGLNDLRYKLSLKREVEILAQLSHAHIVRFKQSQNWTSHAPIEIFISLHEGSLAELIPQYEYDGGLKKRPSFFAPLVEQMLQAIAYLHGKDIIHRDIKPENILYDHKGPGSSLAFYVSDFGLSKIQNPNSSRNFAGSPLYMAPEANRGVLTSKSDIWSFAVMMLLVLGYFGTGEPDLPPEEWRKRMVLLPRYRSDFTLEADLGLVASRHGWENQLRWYGRLQSLVQHKMILPKLRPLLALDAEMRPNAQQCLSSFFPKKY